LCNSDSSKQELDRETDPHRISQRQRQIEFGKNTIVYHRYVIGYIDKWAYKVYLPLESDVKIEHIDEALPSASSLQDFSRQDIRDEDVEKSYNTIKNVLGQLGKDAREAVVGVMRAGNVTPGKQSNKKLTTLTSFRCSNMENDGSHGSQSALLLTDSIITQISRRYAYGKQESEFFAALDKADDDFKKHGKLSTVETPKSYDWHRNLKHQSIKNMGEQAYRERYPLRAVALDKKEWFSWDVASNEHRKERDQETWIKHYRNYDWWRKREAKGKAQSKRTSSDVIANLLRGKRRREATEYDSISQICEKYLKVSPLGDISKAVARQIDRHKASYQTNLKDLVPKSEFEKMRQEKRDNILKLIAICDIFRDRMPRFLIATDRDTWVDTVDDDRSSSSKPVHVLTCRNNCTFHDTDTAGESDSNSDSQVSDLESDAVRVKRNKPGSSGERCEGGSHPTDDEIQQAKSWRKKLEGKIQESGGVAEYKTKYPDRGELLSKAPWWTWPDEKRSYDCQYNGKTISITDERVQGARDLVEWIKKNKRLPKRSDELSMKLSPDKLIESGHATWIENFNKDILRKLDEAPFRQAKKRFQEYFPEVYDILKDDYPWYKVESKKQTLDEKCCEDFQTYMKWIDYQKKIGTPSTQINASPSKYEPKNIPAARYTEEIRKRVDAGRALDRLRRKICDLPEEELRVKHPHLYKELLAGGWDFSSNKWQHKAEQAFIGKYSAMHCAHMGMADDQTLRSLLHQRGLQLYDAGGEGDCQFKALHHQLVSRNYLHDRNVTHETLRLLAVSGIEDLPEDGKRTALEEYKSHHSGNDHCTFEEFMKKMQESGTVWGANASLLGATRQLQSQLRRPVRVWVHIESDTPIEIQSWGEEEQPAEEDIATLHLALLGQLHYYSTRPVSD